jgi:hypothetical protein
MAKEETALGLSVSHEMLRLIADIDEFIAVRSYSFDNGGV